MDIIKEIKNRINIKDLANEYGLNPANNDFIFSIYKEEKNKSLKLYPETNSFYCFATGRGGDLINFYADYWRITNGEAVKELAAKAHLNREENKKEFGVMTPGKTTPDDLQIFRSESEAFYAQCGRESDNEKIKWILERRKEKQVSVFESLEKFCFGPDSEAMEYLQGKKRGLTAETIKKFRLFSITNVNWTVEYLRENFSIEDLLISGLINSKGNFVFNYHKLIIPYLENNRITYLRGRTLPGDQTGKERCKYISLTNFSKTLSLKRFFNFDLIKKMGPGEKLFICEGEFDTMILNQRGDKAIGIPGVTNIDVVKIDKLKNFDLYLAFDNDSAGRKAMAGLAEKLDMPVKGIKIKGNKDVTELVNKTR